MFRTVKFGFLMAVTVSLGAHALTGSGESGTNSLETVSPALVSVTAAPQPSLTATFSEPMLLPGVTTPGNYAVSGPGAGSLSPNPTDAMGPSPYALTWTAGEMRNGAAVTLTATGLQDLRGNPIDPAHNSASCAGIGVPPTFTDLLVAPAQAAAGDTVTIAFTASEALNGEPIVAVDSHDAVLLSKGGSYTYTYTVRHNDPLGMVSLSITGSDLADNMGSLSNDTALQIIEHGSTLPLYAWPAGLALLAVAVAVLLRKRRFGVLLLVAALLASSPALAANPAISNVFFSQGPNGTTGTKVDIYYDLVAPNGPCTIMLSLSKNGGADGFIHPITSYTGDIANVTTGTGRHIVWDIRADYPEENIPQARILVTADDALVQHTLTYTAGPNGAISGTTPQTVNHGGSGTPVTAMADPHCHFVQWSDGVLTATRQETTVVADKSVTATFAINTYAIMCHAAGNGTCSANPATVNHGATSYITVTPAIGWHMAYVVDSEEGLKAGSYTTAPVTGNRTVWALFAINTYGITCNVSGNGTCSANPTTVNHGAMSTITVAPGAGWHISSVVDSEEGTKAGSYATTPVTGNRTVTATFAINTYAITCNAAGNGTCSANPATVDHGATSTITATPAAGWHIVSVVDSVEGLKAGSYATTPVTGNRTITATFAINTYAITCHAAGNGTCSANPATVNHGATSDITVTPAIGWHIVNVVDSDEGLKAGSYTTMPVTGNRTVWALFAINTYDIACHVSGYGICTADPATVDYGNASDITVAPATGWHIASVMDSEEGAKAGSYATTPVTGNRTVTATFAINTYTLRYTAGANGSIFGTSPQTVNYGAAGTAVTAVANGGYLFSQWSDLSTQNPRTDTNVTGDVTVTASFIVIPPPVATSFSINSGAAATANVVVTLNNTAANSPTDYMASESASFSGASWAAYATAPSFTLSAGVGTRAVYFKVKNGAGESGVVSDTIFLVPETISVAPGTFTMGRLSGTNDDTTYGSTAEDPAHSVSLGAYQIGKYEVTNQQYCDVLHWALAQGYLKTLAGDAWEGTGDIYAGGNLQIIVAITSTDCNIQYWDSVFTSKTLVGLPGSTNYSMDTHPMVMVTWYGSVAFCNWLSQMQGLTPCYNMAAANWPLMVAPPASGGYRLPTEAEWERAAAWAGGKHWIYGFTSDTLTGKNRANYWDNAPNYVNPLGLATMPYTSPDAWFNGAHASPNGPVITVNSVSPVGAYDMSGNVWEWCHDWYLSTYYTSGGPPWTNPTGPDTADPARVKRGGGWDDYMQNCRTAFRSSSIPTDTYGDIGFRIAKS